MKRRNLMLVIVAAILLVAVITFGTIMHVNVLYELLAVLLFAGWSIAE